MNRKSILLFAFPALVLLIMAAERMATVLLGAYPASPTVWWAWLELRPLATLFWQQVDFNVGDTMVVDAAMLAAALAVLWLAARARKAAAFLFLANHLALLFAGLMIVASGHSQTASAVDGFAIPSMFPFSLMVTWESSLVLTLGLAACAYCHVAYLRETRQRAEAVAVRLMALKRDF